MNDFLPYSHEFYMKKALRQAQCAFKRGEVPIGAIIVNQEGKIIARAGNAVEHNSSQTAHAELRALARASKKIGDWRLQNCWMYVTVEPCGMCFYAIVLSRCAGVIFGAKSPLFGYQRIDKEGSSWIYKKDALAIMGGVCKEESVNLLQRFFKQKRKLSE